MDLIKISKHAYDRARTRFNIKPKALDRLVEYAFWFGKDTIDDLHGVEYNICKAKQYGNTIYIFSKQKMLITLYKVKKLNKKKLRSFKHCKHWRKRNNH